MIKLKTIEHHKNNIKDKIKLYFKEIFIKNTKIEIVAIDTDNSFLKKLAIKRNHLRFESNIKYILTQSEKNNYKDLKEFHVYVYNESEDFLYSLYCVIMPYLYIKEKSCFVYIFEEFSQVKRFLTLIKLLDQHKKEGNIYSYLDFKNFKLKDKIKYFKDLFLLNKKIDYNFYINDNMVFNYI